MVKTRVGMVGLGIMGSRMCANLVKAGFDVHAFDVDAAALARASGATAAADLRALAARSEVVVLSLPDAGPLRAVCAGEAGLLKHLPKGAVVCDTSTVDPASAREMAALAGTSGVSFLDCPVSGGPPGAQAATLTIMVGGDGSALERARPVLEAIGKKIVPCGPSGSGQAAKLVNQALVAAHTVAAMEALLVGRKAGLSLDTMYSILQTSSGRSWMLENHLSTHALAGKFEPGFALDLMFKDLRLFVETATQLQSPALIGAAALQLYNAARAAGHGKLDQTVVAKELERMAGASLGILGQAG
jgi:3-hydroxyisobutyrate dehydrogenase-like beta-hydroxyacid dehydrogenase